MLFINVFDAGKMNGRADFREPNAEVPRPIPPVPLAATSMLITQGLISKVACIMGYFAGKLSYVKTCQEKFKNLENSPLGEALRSGQARRSSPTGHYSQRSKYDSNVSGHSSFATSPAADNLEKEMLPHYEPIPFSASLNESTPTGITDHIAQGPEPNIEESPKRKNITYEELRNKNRESYEVTLTHKTDPSVRPMQERMPKKEVKVNKYGDTWDE
ncbi:hypothetical protein G4228_004403 [Cervus hanglu yarkandensis]|nr:hypothetical protein G4228_004403 [Cervus hanglu yarkandensis]